MPRSVRFTLLSTIGALMIFGATACKGGEANKPSNPKPPAEPAPRPTAPAPKAAEPKNEAPAAPGATAKEGEAAGKPAAVAVSPEAQKEADNLFTSLCSTCHGPEGKGDGPVAASFPVKPQNYHDKQWQKSTTDQEIAKAIVEGGAAVGKSPLMPANPTLKDKPQVVQALINKIRAFGKQ